MLIGGSAAPAEIGPNRPTSAPAHWDRNEAHAGFSVRAILAGCAFALLVSVGAANGVGAEPPPSGGDAHQEGCRLIDDEAERLRKEYRDIVSANAGAPG